MDGWVRYYPPAVFPSIWLKLEELISSGNLRATEEVLVELKKKEDQVHRWAKAQSDLFIQIDDGTQEVVSTILANHSRLVDTRKNRSFADPFVIALAYANKLTVITGEVASNRLSKPHIPDVCAAMGVSCMSLLGLFQQEGWKV
jgi:chromosome condensin MukBEF complex kleisin-like MukF subunit